VSGAGGAELAVGSVLAGRYRILAKLGEGAMGSVYVAEHVRIGRRDAVKVLREALASDREAIARFERGARNVSAILHPNVCTIYDFSETDDGLRFLAMEFIEGETLKDVLDRDGALPADRAIDIARQTADALQAAHDAGIVHRDLKPGNIMLARGRDGRDHVKVVDFDIAKGPDEGGEEVTRHGFVVGTPEYMSPEQLMGERLDGRSDVYALGIVLFRMLTGVLPFRAASPQELMIARLTTPPLRLDEARPDLAFPAGLQSLLDRALERRPDDRPATAAELSRGLAPFAAGRPVAADAKSPAAAAQAGSPRPAGVVAPARDDVPATRVAEAPAARRRRAGLPLAVGGGTLVVAVLLLLVLLPGRRDSGGGELGQRPQPPPIATGGAGPSGPEPDTAAPRPRNGGDAPRIPPPSPPPEPRRLPFDAAQIDAILSRQVEVMLELAPGSRSAARDTLRMLWDAGTAVTARNRATVAATLADDALEGRDYGACVMWMERALQLAPSDAYRRQLEACRARAG
jgi:tRNA A-37 threonylcarbamoyl transferase component Bud32